MRNRDDQQQHYYSHFGRGATGADKPARSAAESKTKAGAGGPAGATIGLTRSRSEETAESEDDMAYGSDEDRFGTWEPVRAGQSVAVLDRSCCIVRCKVQTSSQGASEGTRVWPTAERNKTAAAPKPKPRVVARPPKPPAPVAAPAPAASAAPPKPVAAPLLQPRPAKHKHTIGQRTWGGTSPGVFGNGNTPQPQLQQPKVIKPASTADVAGEAAESDGLQEEAAGSPAAPADASSHVGEIEPSSGSSEAAVSPADVPKPEVEAPPSPPVAAVPVPEVASGLVSVQLGPEWATPAPSQPMAPAAPRVDDTAAPEGPLPPPEAPPQRQEPRLSRLMSQAAATLQRAPSEEDSVTGGSALSPSSQLQAAATPAPVASPPPSTATAGTSSKQKLSSVVRAIMFARSLQARATAHEQSKAAGTPTPGGHTGPDTPAAGSGLCDPLSPKRAPPPVPGSGAAATAAATDPPTATGADITTSTASAAVDAGAPAPNITATATTTSRRIPGFMSMKILSMAADVLSAEPTPSPAQAAHTRVHRCGDAIDDGAAGINAAAGDANDVGGISRLSIRKRSSAAPVRAMLFDDDDTALLHHDAHEQAQHDESVAKSSEGPASGVTTAPSVVETPRVDDKIADFIARASSSTSTTATASATATRLSSPSRASKRKHASPATSVPAAPFPAATAESTAPSTVSEGVGYLQTDHAAPAVTHERAKPVVLDTKPTVASQPEQGNRSSDKAEEEDEEGWGTPPLMHNNAPAASSRTATVGFTTSSNGMVSMHGHLRPQQHPTNNIISASARGTGMHPHHATKSSLGGMSTYTTTTTLRTIDSFGLQGGLVSQSSKTIDESTAVAEAEECGQQ